MNLNSWPQSARTLSRSVLLVVSVLSALRSAAPACTVPVFRYALDRWPAESWKLEAPRASFLSGPTAPLLRNLGGTSPLNLSAKPLADESATDARLRFPDTGIARTVWSGTLTAESFQVLADSPARGEIARRLLSGDSLVWVMVTAGDAAPDAALTARLQKRLTFVQNVAELPVIDPEDPSSQLGPGPELKLQFSQLTVRRDDPAESVFISMLAGPGGEKLVGTGDPFAAVVFGRGRVLGAWAAGELTDERLDETNLFLTRACACQVKGLHPGWDLLMNTDWDDELRKAQESRLAPPVPVLTEPAGVSAPLSVPIATGLSSTTTAAPPQEGNSRVWQAGMAVVIVAILAAAGFSRRRCGKESS